jgi:hypothetical protein
MNEIILILLFSGLFTAYILLQRRKIADGEAKFWSTVSEPLFYISGDIKDDAVSVRAAYARAKLAEHGNVFLNPETDVWEEVYSASPLTTSRDFSAWQDLVLLNIVKRREIWRAEKLSYNEQAAKAQFGGQAKYTITTVGGNETKT